MSRLDFRSLDQRMIENSALRLGGGLWNAIAGHDEPFGLTSVCAARPNFFPPMPAQYPSFKIGGLMGVACWQQYDTMSVSPSGNFEPSFSHHGMTDEGSWTRQQGFPVLIVNHSVEQGGKAGQDFAHSTNFSLKVNLIVFEQVEVWSSFLHLFWILSNLFVFLFPASCCLESQCYVGLVAIPQQSWSVWEYALCSLKLHPTVSWKPDMLGLDWPNCIELHSSDLDGSFPQLGWDSLRPLHNAGGLALQQRWFLADGSEEPDDEKTLFCDFLQFFYWWKRSRTSVDDV